MNLITNENVLENNIEYWWIHIFRSQLAGLDLQDSHKSGGGRYVPPHLRNKPASK